MSIRRLCRHNFRTNPFCTIYFIGTSSVPDASCGIPAGDDGMGVSSWVGLVTIARNCACFDLGHGCRSAILVEGLRPTECRGMFDAMFEGFTTLWIGRHV